MRELIPTIAEWRSAGKRIAVATVVSAYGSAPRREGARLIVSDEGELAGSVSGGCVEGDVLHQALEVLECGGPRLLRYAITDEMIWEVGLACGGTVEIFVEPLEMGGE
ncbi:MAG: XdhC family protein [Anaerolineales bacterium]|nr:XdhC family protein [Anaerolineales bacterium]MCB9128936.1 XdhC family protein [Ardenticatenales bacterium]